MANFGGDRSMPIAVIGMGCRFPGDATSPDRLWELLVKGRSAWSEFPQDRINIDGFYHPSGDRQGSICFKGGHFLKDDVAAFDAPFFSTTSHEAAAMDPQQRILLEVSYEAFENAGIPMESLPGSATAVYCGSFVKDYEQIVLRDPDDSPQYAATGNGIAIMSNRISWFYDLHGPSMTLDTGCSASLVGVHLACQSLRTGESTMAMAMGAGLILTPATMMPMTALNFLSPDGKCFTFDERANGYGRGEGLGAIILKPLEAALRDNDTIRAVIRGSGVNQDGRTPGITMPSKDAQAMNIRAVYKAAGLGYDQTAYFEAHGTGTQAGDPTELGAIADTFAETRDTERPMFVGSVKTNIGHLEGCAGIAGLVKGILMLENGLIPPNLYFEKVNPNIDLDGWKIKVPVEVTPWPQEGLRRVSINCFGFGGTNAHLIVDDALHYFAERGLAGKHASLDLSPSPTPSLVDSGIEVSSQRSNESPVTAGQKHRLFVISSHEEKGISRLSASYSGYLEVKYAGEIYDEELLQLSSNLAYTLACRRSKLPWKSILVSSSTAKLSSQFRDGMSKPVRSSRIPNIAFVFSGQGAQWFAMGRELLQYEQFSKGLEKADAYMKTIGSEWSLMAELLKDEKCSIVNLPRISQPLCTALQVALVDLLKYWNVEPYAVVGHSSGEIAAAYSLGALTREDAWKLAFHRGRLTSAIKYLAPKLKGRMMAVALSKEATEIFIRELRTGTAIVACINSPDSVTVSGDESAVLELKRLLAADGVFVRLLKVENAYHSSHMKVIERHYLNSIKDIRILEPVAGRMMFSSVTGNAISSKNLGPGYWVENMVSPVKFSDAMNCMLNHSIGKPDILLELGPHAVLQGPLKQILDTNIMPKSRPIYFSMLYRGKDAVATSLEAIGNLWTNGCPASLELVDQGSSDQSPSVLTDLPPYPWNHSKTYWHESHLGKVHRFRKHPRQDLIGAPTVESTVFEPRWRGFIRISENPWVQDHQVQNTIIYPAAGMVSMVLEGARQVQDEDRTIEGYEISNMSIDKAMIIPISAHGLETSLTMKRHNNKESTGQITCEKFDFTVYSKILDAAWQKNCSGLLSIHYKCSDSSSSSKVNGVPSRRNDYREEYLRHRTECTEVLPARQLYETLETIGMKYGQTFQNITSIQKKGNVSCTTVQIPDTKSRMPLPAKFEYPHLIHPATLDAMFQTIFVAGNEPMVPSFLESLFISAEFPQGAGIELCGYSKASRKGLRDATGSIVMSDAAWEKPKLIIKNLHFTALSNSSDGLVDSVFLPNHHNLCMEIVWKEDIATANPSSLLEWLDLASHKSPNMNILHVGDWSGDLSISILTAIGGKNAATPRFSKFTFTDTSSEKTDEVRIKEEYWPGYVDFKELDLTNETSQQGFKDRSFDLVFANATNTNFLSAVRGLLKTDGTFILMNSSTCLDTRPENTGDKSELGQENSLETVAIANFDKTLFESGFAEPKFTLKDSCENGEQEVRVFIPKLKITELVPLSSTEVLILLPANPSPELHRLSLRLTEALMISGGKVSSNTLVDSQVSFSGKVCLALLEIDAPLVCAWTVEEFRAFRDMISKSKGCLWITKGGQMNSKLPFSAPIIALFRTIRSEDPQKTLVTLDLDAEIDQVYSDSIGRAIASTFLRSFDSVERSEETEYAECGGKVFIPRIILEEQLSSRIEYDGQQRRPQLQPLSQSERPLKLEVGTLGKLDSLQFNDDTVHLLQIGPQDIEIRACAVGINQFDLETALGRTALDSIGTDVAGIVTKVGSSVSRFKIGDRVFTVVPGAFKTLVRSQEFVAQPIPDKMSFETAASLLADSMTAYYAINTVGRLQERESILVNGGSHSFILLAVQIAKNVGAEVFIAGASMEDQITLEQICGIREDQIVSAKPNGFNLTTQVRKFDMILNSFDGELGNQAWSYIREYGRFIDLSIGDAAKNGHLQKASHVSNVTYSTFDISHMIKSNMALTSRLLQSTFDMISADVIQQLTALKVFAFSEITTAFQEMKDKNQTSKVILRVSEDDIVRVVLRDENPLQLDPSATYVLVGGLGGLGRSLTGLLIRHGAKNIAFFSRSGAVSEPQLNFISSLQEQDITAHVYKCDICNETQLKAAIQQCTEEMSPIRGVIQGAAVIRDAIFENMTYDDWETTIKPKVQGSWNLSCLMPQDLDFFVLLSSSAGVIGARGQANYAAGNVFQDALAHYRRGQGMRAVSLDLGPILGVGMVAEDEATLDILRSSGFLGVREKDFHLLAIAAMTGYTQDGHTTPAQVIVGTGTGGIMKQNNVQDPYWHSSTMFSITRGVDLPPSSSDSSSSGVISMQDLLSSATSLEEATSIVTEGLAQLLSKSMNMLPADLDTSKPANAYGVDSLVAVSTRNWMFRETSVDVSVFEILSENSIVQLAGRIARDCRFVAAELKGNVEEM